MIPEIQKILYVTDLSENARYAFGYALSMANHYDAKITVIHIVEELSPFAQAYNNMGGALAKMGKDDEAILYFKKALEINIDFRPAARMIEETKSKSHQKKPLFSIFKKND